ncbi:AMP-dependent synthetase and ligase [Candidatus Desulfarcum epimagneticum]|uniref:AMP-dependent synthetase and ligase n=1 Tax=uncultured Desulfobacteraceae bacterium TaxID=218296 RepID=A0A484HLW5_9BACT|nr:AMP-dependent synthetase and ligase [uncultured Desulfobacteraceae bacterium]
MGMKDFQNIHAFLKDTVERKGDEDAYRWFVSDSETQSTTWNGFYSQVKDAGKSLMALGVKKDDKVNILSYSCYKWVMCDFALTSIASCAVGIYHSNLAHDCRYIIDHSDSVLVFAEDKTQLDKLFEIRKEIPKVMKVVLFNGDHDDDWVISFDEFLKLGKDVSDEDFMARANSAAPGDTAGIVYTSGTTGVPKGAVLTHDNIVFTAQSALECFSTMEGDETFLFLPLAHVFARICVYAALASGAPTTFARSIDTLIDDIKVAKPHWFASVPRIYEKVYSKVLSGAESKGGLALKIFNWACSVGEQVSDLKLKKEPIPGMLNFKYGLANKLVFSKLQDALGGNVRWCASGAAPLNASIAQFFHAAGILILEGIGMTENTSFTNLNRYDHYRFGWVGQTGPGVEQKIAEDGEILYRGRNVMKEYYKMPEETAETLIDGGWLRTGDLGEIDADGFLRVTGRKKDLIITAGGKNIAPSAIEGVLGTSKYIANACVIGDRRKYLTAVVNVDMENIVEYAETNGIDFNDPLELIEDSRIIEMVENEVADKNREFASFETIKKIAIVPEFTIENGFLTPTLKLKKNVIVEAYNDRIEALYPKD